MQGLCGTVLKLKLDFHRGVGMAAIAANVWARRFVDIGNHVLTLWNAADDIVVNHDRRAVLIHLNDEGDTCWIEVLLLGNLLHQVPNSALGQVDCMVVVG